MLISIIIPVYNSEKTINRCVYSIINNGVKNDYEILLVDDGSTDHSLECCRLLSKSHNHITVLHQKNSGAAAARNYGIAEAKGEYLAFVDSDDTVSTDYLQTLFKYITTCRFDLLWFNMRAINESGKELFSTKHNSENFITQKDYLSCFFGMNLSIGSMCTKIYKRDFINKNNIKLCVGRIYGEDWDFNLQIGVLNPTILCIPEILYYYVKYTGYLTVSTKYSFGDYDDYKNSYIRLLELDSNFNLHQSIYEQGATFIYNIISLLLKLMNSDLEKEKKSSEYYRIVNDCVFLKVLNENTWDSRFMSRRQRLVVRFIKAKFHHMAKILLKL